MKSSVFIYRTAERHAFELNDVHSIFLDIDVGVRDGAQEISLDIEEHENCVIRKN